MAWTILLLAGWFVWVAGAAAETIALGPEQTGFRLLESDGNRIVVEFTLSALEKEAVTIQGQSYALYGAPGLAYLMEVGAPQLPVAREALIIPDEGRIEVRVQHQEKTVLATEPVVPSKGHLTRDKDPATVPYTFGPVYASAGFYPPEVALSHEPFIIRDFRGAVLEIRPVRFDPSTGSLEVTTRITVEVFRAPGSGINEIQRAEPPRALDPEFANFYANLFLNYDPLRYDLLPEPGRCLIITYDSFHDAAAQLLEWKLKKGIPTLLVDKSQIGNTANDIKAYIQSLYDEPEGLTYIILIGDVQQIPTLYGSYEGAPSDPCYVKLAGNDHYPDALISRLPAQTINQAQYLVHKVVRYEESPDLSEPEAAWYHKACGIGSAEGGWSGYTDCQRIGLLNDMLLAYTYTEADQICDPGATPTQVFNAVNDGRSVLNYIGHGSGTSWGTTGFSNSHVHQLENGYMQPLLIDVSCDNGNFTMNECFGEAWMRTGDINNPAGAVAYFGASTLASWIPPCDMQNEAIRLLTQEIRNTVGGLCFNGILRAMELWPGSEGIKLMEQYNILGDCSMVMRTDVPAPLAVQHDGTLPLGQDTYDVTVAGVPGALVSLYGNGILYGSAYTDQQGQATIQLDVLPTETGFLTLTVTAYNHETVEEPVELIEPTLANIVLDSFSISDAGEETENGQVEAGEQVLLTVVLRNTGQETAVNVTATLGSSSPWVSFVDSVAAFGDIPPGETRECDAPYVLLADPDAEDGSLVMINLDIRADPGHWEAALGFVLHRPDLFVVTPVQVTEVEGDGDGYIEAGETADIVVTLGNQGSGDAAAIQARLAVGTLMIQIPQPLASLDYLPAGQEGTLQPAFRIAVSPQAQDQDVSFVLRYNGANGLSGQDVFELHIGEPTSDVPDLASLPTDRVYLLPPVPNPVQSGARFVFNLPEPARVDLAIYDAQGRRVMTLLAGEGQAGVHDVRWGGTDARGTRVASGIYFAKLRAGSVVMTRQVLVVR
jgi:hypothetical protein